MKHPPLLRRRGGRSDCAGDNRAWENDDLDSAGIETVTRVVYWSGEGMRIPAGGQDAGKAVGLRERHFRTLVENSPDLITRFDRGCRTLYANPAAVKALGAHTGALLGSTHRERGLPGSMVASSEATIRRVFETGEEQIFEMAVDGPEGMKHYLARCVPEYGEDGVIESALVIHRDITAHKTAEKALRESEKHYQELFAAARRQATEVELLDRVRTALAGELERAAHHPRRQLVTRRRRRWRVRTWAAQQRRRG